jgi:hypothetical protein
VLILAGDKLNGLSRGIVTASAAAHSLFPLTRLGIMRPSQPFQFNAAASGDYVSCDLDVLAGAGRFESGVTGWAGSGGTFAQSGAQFNDGANSASLSHSALASRTYDVTLRAGEAIRVTASGRGGGGSVAARVRMQNIHTGNYLQSGGTWSSTATNLVNQTTAAWSNFGPISSTVETWATCRRALVTLRITVELSQSGTVYFDTIKVWPQWDFVTVHGHNCGPVTAEILRSTDGSAFTSEATPTIYSPSWYWYRSAGKLTEQYARLRFNGTNHEPIRLGEIVVGQAIAPVRSQNWGYELETIEADVFGATASGEDWTIPLTASPRRMVTMVVDDKESSLTEAEEIFDRTRGRQHPIVVVPDHTVSGSIRSHQAILGTIEPRFNTQARLVGVWGGRRITVAERPLWSSAL